MRRSCFVVITSGYFQHKTHTFLLYALPYKNASFTTLLWEPRQVGQLFDKKAVHMRKKAICHGIVIKIMPRLQLIDLNVQAGNDMCTLLNAGLETTEKIAQDDQQEQPH